MLVNCSAYQDGRKIAEFGTEDIHKYLQLPGCFVWVALRDASETELAEMQRQFGLHELAVEDASHGHQRPKLEEYDDFVYAVVHTVELVAGELHAGEVNLFVGCRNVVSIRYRTHQGFAEVLASCVRDPHLLKLGPGFVFYALIDTIVDRYFPVVEELEDELERLERGMFSDAPARENIERLYGLKQRLMELKHATGPLQETVTKLHGGRVPEVCTSTQEYFRDVDDHLTRINQTIDGVREMLTTAISVHLSLLTLGDNETTKRRAAYGALVAVPTMIAGVYGMNFEFMPELKWIWGYPLSVALMVAIDVYLFVRFRKARWL
jgi:magnesium transporter